MPTETITLKLVAQDLASGNISKAIGGIDKLAQRGGIAGSMIQGVGLSMGMMLNPLNLMTKGIGIASDAIGGSINAYTDFDEAMTESTAIMGDLTEAMEDDLADAAREVAKVTRFSATEAAEAYYFLASAGLDAAESIGALPRVAQFATAGAFNLAQATDLLTDAQSALGLTVDDTAENMDNMTRVSDVLVKANTLANASVEQFSVALTSKAGAALKAFGIDLEEGVAVLGAFADQGVKAEEAGNALDRILRLLPDAAQKNKKAFKEFNVAVFDSEGEVRNLADIVEDLEGALEGMSDAEKQAALSALGFQARVQGIIKPLLGTSKNIRRYERELRKAGGTTKEVADKQLESFNAKLDTLKSRVNDVAMDLGGTLVDAIVEVGEAIDDISDKVDVMDMAMTEGKARVAFENLAADIGVSYDELAQRIIDASGEASRSFKSIMASFDDLTAAEKLAVMEGGKFLADIIRMRDTMPEVAASFGTLGKSVDGVASETEEASDALKAFKDRLDEFDDVRSLEQVNKAIKRQTEAIKEAKKEGDYAAWARHKARLADLKGERQKSQQAKAAFEASQAQSEKRKATIKRIAEQAGVSEQKVRDELKKTGGKVDVVKKKLGVVEEKLTDIGETEATPKIGMDLTEWNRRMAEWRADMAEIRNAKGEYYDPTTGTHHTSGTGGSNSRSHTGGVIAPGETAVIRQNEAVITPASRTAVVPLDGPGAPTGGRGGVTLNISFDGAYITRGARDFVADIGPELTRWQRQQGVA